MVSSPLAARASFLVGTPSDRTFSIPRCWTFNAAQTLRLSYLQQTTKTSSTSMP